MAQVTEFCVVAQDMYDYLKSVCTDLVTVQGDFDESVKWPDTAVVTIGGFKIGVFHGHQIVPYGNREALAVVLRRLDVDILVTGHTHAFSAYRHEGCLVINPGSATGAYNPANPAPTPSFALMDVDAGRAMVYVYELVDDEIKVDKIEFVKDGSLR